MKTVIITGSAGLIGWACVLKFHGEGWRVVGVDNGGREVYFGEGTKRDTSDLENYRHQFSDIRDGGGIHHLWSRVKPDAVVHAAGQPSHDLSRDNPTLDFSVNVMGTHNVLEATRTRCPEAAFIFLSTNKVYGDAVNRLPFDEMESRFELPGHSGVSEWFAIDPCRHTIFGAHKLAADFLVQEYGHTYGMRTTCLRCGCITGKDHAGVELHGFLSYLMKCAKLGKPYMVHGFHGKQVRDQLHASDLAEAIWWVITKEPPKGGTPSGTPSVFNMGGGRDSNCSVLEAIKHCERLTGKPMAVSFDAKARAGDHKWWITDTSRFRRCYPEWQPKMGLVEIFEELYLS